MEDAPSEWRMLKLAIGVELKRAGRDPERAELFIDNVAGASAIAGEVAALLESDTQFVPVREPDAPGGSQVALVGKRAIAWVAVPLVRTDDDDTLALFDHQHEVRVELDITEPIFGRVLYSSPADRPRLIDHLNLGVHFVRVWTTEVLYLINKQHIVRVVELD